MRAVYYFNSDEGVDTSIFQSLHPRFVKTKVEIANAIRRVTDEALWIIPKREIMELLPTMHIPRRKAPELMILGDITPPSHEILRNIFRKVILEKEISLPLEELVEVMSAKNRADLMIGGVVDLSSKIILFFRGDFSSILVPFSAFQKSGDGTTPDFSKFSITDYGQTIRLGKYEASTESILYEFDADFRRRYKKNLIKIEKGLGASMRRLRLQRGLRQADIANVDEKEIRRIEAGEIKKPHATTLKNIALALEVDAAELGSY